MKKGIVLILVLMMVMFCFTGCMYGEEHITLNADGTGTMASRIEIEKAVYDELMTGLGMSMEDMGMEGASVETVDGIECYVFTETAEFDSLEALAETLEEGGYTGVYVSQTGIRYVFDSGTSEEDVAEMEAMGFDLGDSMAVKIAVTMPDEIVMTTGTLSEDKMTAEFHIEGNALYELHDIVVSTAAETKKPTINGYTAKKTYNSARTVTVKDASGIKKVQYKYKKPGADAYGKYQTMDLTATFAKNGTYMVRAYDCYGNKTTKSFTIKDTKKPVIEGVENKKTYTTERVLTFSDNCGISSVKLTVNGESFKLNSTQIADGVRLSDEGDYKVVAKDVNGNSRTVTFTVK